jgi:hypothetical protein
MMADPFLSLQQLEERERKEGEKRSQSGQRKEYSG